VDLNKPSTIIAVCTKLLKMKIGDKQRIESIRARAEQGRMVYQLDLKYVEKMAVYIKFEENNSQEEGNPEPTQPSPPSPRHKIEPTQPSPPSPRHKIESKPKRSFFKRKRKTPKDEPKVDVRDKDWFWDNVEFKRQSKLSICIGIISIIFSFSTFAMLPSGNSYSGMSGSAQMGTVIMVIITWIIMVLTGIVLISLGARQVPKYPSVKRAIEKFVNEKINS
tara:strand:- start:174 stop:836 length:663 start_codon:yes stop_codon:yes gene_type:complete